jgi:peptide/nickel transport system substrate-binding protein
MNRYGWKKALVVVLLVFLSAAGLWAKGETEGTITPTSTAPGEPQYGGTFTWLCLAGIYFPPKSWDDTTGYWHATEWNLPAQAWLVVGDFEKYGPRGSNEFAFQNTEDVPAMYHKGDLAETFEIQLDKAVFHLRKGVMFAGNDRIGMKPREITSEDVVMSLEHAVNSAVGKSIYDYVKKISAPDKYTVVVDWNYSYTWPFWWDGAMTGIVAKETFEAGIDEWYNQVSSGPFIIKDYVENTAVYYEKNPNYTREKTVINGKEYAIPFIDKLVYPYIHDESTYIAALRTAQLDGIQRTPLKYEQTLKDTSPEINMYKYPSGTATFINWQCKPGGTQKWLSKDLRRAMAIGTDRASIGDAIFGIGNWTKHVQFSYGGPPYTSIEDMPASTKELFTYDPDKAKKMLADLGYGDGFDMDMVIAASNADQADMSSMLKEQWAKLGVNVNIKTLENAAHLELRMSRDFKDAYMDGDSVSIADIKDMKSNEPQNSTSNYDPVYDAGYDKACTMMDPVDQGKQINSIVLRYLDNATRIQLPSPKAMVAMWGWAQNYYGEVEAGFWNTLPAITRIWIDQDMKKQLGH